MPATTTRPEAGKDIYERTDSAGSSAVSLNLHPGQWEAYIAPERFVAVLSGTQAGKTSLGPWWLAAEIYGDSRRAGRGSGDYLAVTASYDLFKLKMLPAIREVFEGIHGVGRYWSGDRIMELRDPTTGRFWARKADDPMWGRVILRSAEAGSGLESSTAKAALLDEAGMDSFTDETWWSILSRLSLHMGRVLITTTLYNFGWLKTEVHDRWKAGDPDYRVVHFDSIANPAFPREEWDRARRSMPPWRFDLRYRGRYSKPAGLIYDSYEDEPAPVGHLVKRFDVPVTWPRFVGLDFGGVHTAAVFFAQNPLTKEYFAYREYMAGNLTSREHADAIRAGEPGFASCVGGSGSEDQWRKEFGSAGLAILKPDVSDVAVGIDRVYGGFKERKVFVFDDLSGLRAELKNYSRKLGQDGEPTDVIEAKATYHRLDASRYVLGWLLGPSPVERGRITSAGNPLAGYRGTSRGIKRPGRDAGEY